MADNCQLKLFSNLRDSSNEKYTTLFGVLVVWKSIFFNSRPNVPIFDISNCRSFSQTMQLKSCSYVQCKIDSILIDSLSKIQSLRHIVSRNNSLSSNMSSIMNVTHYCMKHDTFHICGDYPLCEEMFYSNEPNNIFIPLRRGPSLHYTFTVDNLAKSTIVFTSCKYNTSKEGIYAKKTFIDDNEETDYANGYSYKCFISGNPIPSRFLSNLTNTKTLIDTTTTLPQNSISIIQPNDDRIILISRRLCEELHKIHAQFPEIVSKFFSCQTLDFGLTSRYKTFLDILSMVVPHISTPKKKYLIKQNANAVVREILDNLFYNENRAKYHVSMLEKKTKDAQKALKQYYEQCASNRELPILIDAFTLFCSTLSITSAQSGTLIKNVEFIESIQKTIYRHWIIICFSPHSLRGDNNIDFTSIVLSILFTMRMGGRDLGSQKIICGDIYIEKYLCSQSDLDYFGYKKKQLTEGDRMIERAYASFLENDIPISQKILL